MTDKKIKNYVEYLKVYSLDMDGFLCDVAAYMERVGWTWFDYDHIPVKREISEEFYKLLDSLSENHTYVETRGFRIEVNDMTDSIDCVFLERHNNNVVTSISTNHYFNDPVVNFINHLCRECPVLNRDQLIEKYKEWK